MRKLPEQIKQKCNEWNNYIGTLNFEPFVIDIKFKVGRMGNSFLNFDSVFGYFILQNLFGKEFFNYTRDFDEPIIAYLPVKKEIFGNEEDYFYWLGGIYNIPNNINFYTKRAVENRLDLIKEKKIRTNAGPFKDYKIPMLYDNNKTYRIYGIGHIETIKSILPQKLYLGKKTSQGWGECNIDINIIPGLPKEFIRPLPKKYCESNNIDITGRQLFQVPIHAPYFGIDCKYYECYY